MGTALFLIFVKPIEILIEVAYDMFFRVLKNPGATIVVVSLIVNILVLPLYNRADALQEQDRQERKKIEPYIRLIRSAFKGDERAFMMNELYRQQGYSPLSGLKGGLSLLLQVPFFMAAYHFLSNLSVLQGSSFLFIKDLGAEDQLFYIGSFPVNILPLLMTMINIISGIIYTRGFPMKDKIQLYALAGIFLVLLYHSPSGLVMYWMLNNLFSLFKNIFTKYVCKIKKVLSIALSVGSALLFLALLLSGKMYSGKRMIFMILIVMISQIPLFLYFLEKKGKLHKDIYVPAKHLFLGWAVVLIILNGILIPSVIVSLSPEEFMELNNAGCSPLYYVFSTFCISLGTFGVWLSTIYYMTSEKKRGIVEYLAAVAAVISIVNFMFFGNKLGNISSMLIYDHIPSYSLPAKMLNLLIVSGIIVLTYVLYRKKCMTALKSVCVIMVISCICMSTVNLVKTHNTVKELSYSDNADLYDIDEKIIPLSRKGKNVMVIMLDRAISGYVPYMFEEKKILREQFSGFTYYPNTTSFGAGTFAGTTSLFGGYEYTPEEVDKRDKETLLDKHNEALKMLPTLLGQNGYEVTVCDPPFANHQWISDVSIYDDCETVKAYITDGRYNGFFTMDHISDIKSYRQRSFFCYSIFRTAPVVIQSLLYDKGKYYSVEADKYNVQYEVFLNSYSTLKMLPQITRIEDEHNTCLLYDVNMTHDPVELQLPDYTFEGEVDNSGYETGIRNDKDGNIIKLETHEQIIHYYTDLAAFLALGDFFDYLKEMGLYDNTRIVICSDHGAELNQFKSMRLWEDFDVERVNALLMYKDFGSEERVTDPQFMTLADIPSMLVDGLMEDPVNPFTKNTIDNTEKYLHPQRIIYEGPKLGDEGNKYNIKEMYTVHDDIFRKENWVKLTNSDY
ncbi:MAG: membrane protein insertase YidC [Lachnospiraceae bacterium]|nr:membrane protein insertase YidC [Lachnospiraceae bacterium]